MKYLLLFLLLSLSIEVFSQCESLASYHYDDMQSSLDKYGYSLRRTYTYGQLGRGQKTTATPRKFYRGTKYFLGVMGDSNAKDIDIYVYDAAFNLVIKDSSIDKASAVTFIPRYTGTYYIIVKMYDTIGYRKACWTLAYGYK